MEKEKIVLFLGHADREGVTAKLKAVGTRYKRKMLESTTDNWKTIISFFDQYEVTSVVVKMTNTAFGIFVAPHYGSLVNDLLTRVSKVPNLFLAHESLITGIDSYEQNQRDQKLDDFDPDLEPEYEYMDSFYDGLFTPPDSDTRTSVISLLENYGLTLIPYKKNVELSLLASSFIDQNESNLIFRIYIPAERMWANEAEKLLLLFREYLQKASHLDVRQEQYSTKQGVVHEFYSGDSIDPSILPKEFEEFSTFMDTCVSNPDSASALLVSKNMSSMEVIKIVERYSKEARRLHIDLKQEREMKSLTIKHRLESELGEFVRTDEDWASINTLVDSAIPKFNGIDSALLIDRSSLIPVQNNLTVNIKPQIIESVNGVVAQEIIGDQHLGTDAKQLLELIEKFADKNKTELASAVHELVDVSSKKEDRLNAKQKLKGFLLTAGGKAGEVATGLLQTFIENQIGL
ncbi:hypothetical protein [Pseudoalteromonas sp. NGC95]|uniref:hypothetical protein n=1 Tax=Pseudoalteromonas sp. NGC95 TaxID=2792051 RepID=UPI0018CD2482|nr:hypothetical protein [Pseudoalteromonas sp. NGC95]MBH0017345.1 hypothetical protein [Pseudoalteromonas sp. NGC95]